MPILCHALRYTIQQDPDFKELIVSLARKEISRSMTEKKIQQAVGEVFTASWRRQYLISNFKEKDGWTREWKQKKGSENTWWEVLWWDITERAPTLICGVKGEEYPWHGWGETWQAQAMTCLRHLWTRLVRSAHAKRWETVWAGTLHWAMGLDCKSNRKGEPTRS